MISSSFLVIQFFFKLILLHCFYLKFDSIVCFCCLYIYEYFAISKGKFSAWLMSKLEK